MRFILFRACGETYAVAAEHVQELHEARRASPLPFTPDYVDGLVEHGGQVLVQVDLGRRLGGRGSAGDGPAAREAMVLNAAGGPFVVTVEEVLLLASIPDGAYHVRDPGDAAAADHADLVCGDFEWHGRTVLCLSPQRLGLDGVAGGADLPGGHTVGSAPAETPARPAGPPLQPFMIVVAGGERFAVPVEVVDEVVEIPALTRVPHAEHAVLGIMLLRGEPRLVASLARLLGIRGSGEPASGLVVDHQGLHITLACDQVLGLRRFSAPARGGAGQSRDARYLTGADGRLIGLIDLEELIDTGRLARYRRLVPESARRRERRADARDRRHLLAFRMGPERCGVDVAAVERVVEPGPLAAVPSGAKDTLCGLAEVAGEVVPVLDLRPCFNGSREQGPETAFLILRAAGERVALVVDRVDRFVDLPPEAMQPAGDGPGRLAAEVGRDGGGLLSVLDLDAVAAAA